MVPAQLGSGHVNSKPLRFLFFDHSMVLHFPDATLDPELTISMTRWDRFLRFTLMGLLDSLLIAENRFLLRSALYCVDDDNIVSKIPSRINTLFTRF
ncbi:hypothetical protein NC652_029086 [Populus alba x Populus x berolinensis]|uniref:Uncharacterized protein n=1 Tax=Populus alba x Populus x berolinensis TaxID=444605 RepID=A0AAD6M0P5_9ROSI|nr:hypothetical protein NC652_029086 [Populus alba x Populus x berolinensis]KAJ6976768.1 hypothetical protein NC653_028820 [Populus alba x Populus x berolinensis]